MGLLVDGKWVDRWYDTKSTGGRFERSASQFRNWITEDGDAGPSGHRGFPAARDRYHLYVSLACPWAHRTLIFRALKGLQGMIGISVVNPYMLEDGWTFEPGDGVIRDTVNGATRLHELYTLADDAYSGRVTVPVLWDKRRHTIVSNESAEILRMFNSAFDHLGARAEDYYPDSLADEIDQINAFVYDNINNGVYKAGFATSQNAYEEAVDALFAALDTLEQRLSERRYLLGDVLTEADWRLFTTLIRFDEVYVGHFKCNRRQLFDYPHLRAYVCELYQVPGIAETVNFSHIKAHYYGSHKTINPTGIVPVGPNRDFTAPHGRDTRFGAQGTAA